MMELMMFSGQIPEIQWEHGDDLCDCTFQRIGWWTNPYMGKTMEFRLCCAWEKLLKLHPELGPYYREIPAFHNYNTDRYETEPREWDGEDDMPRALWYRQLASQTGESLDEVRRKFAHLMPPKGVPRPEVSSATMPTSPEQDPFLIQFLQAEMEREGLDFTISDIKQGD